MVEVRRQLAAHRDALRSSSLFAKWKRDNPNEYAACEFWWSWGGVRPQPKTAFGAAYVASGDAFNRVSQTLPEPIGDIRWP